MGYYTDFEITVTGIDNANQAVKIAKEYELYDYDVSDDGKTLTSETNEKWYEWKKDSVALSKNYPRILIEINGTGEESEDIWKARIRNGECEVIKAKIVFDDFKTII
jgi:hypothetical protein